MDDDVKKQLLGWLKEAADVAKDQAPKACQDLVMAGTIKFATLIAAGLLVTLAGAVCLWKVRKWAKTYTDNDGGEVAAMFVASSPLLIGVAMMFANAYWLLVCIYAPRAYLLDVLGVTK